MRKEKWIYKSKFIVFYFTKSFDISFELCGYFDNRPRINFDLFFFSLAIILPFKNKWTDECDPPKWGIAIHNNTFWIYRGGKGNSNGGNKWWTWNFPFVTKDWVRTSILLSTDTRQNKFLRIFNKEFVPVETWEHETKGHRKNFYNAEWKQKQKSWTYDYTDSYDGEIISTTIYVKEREWRPKWLKWTKLFRTVDKSIDVHFSKECGKGKGSYKGGTLGCDYIMLPNEKPLDCLKRMEKERKF